MKIQFFLFLFTFLSIAGNTQDVYHTIIPPHQQFQGRSVQFYLDNDAFSGFEIGEDRNYTMGILIGYTGPDLAQSPIHWLNRNILKAGWRLFHPKKNSTKFNFKPLSASIYLANITFTPEDLTSFDPVIDDRPYASLTHIDTRFRYYDAKLNHTHSLGISYGVLGTGASKFVQTLFHTIHPKRPIPQGWHNQISHPWEPSFLINYQRNRYGTYAAWQTLGRRRFMDWQETISMDIGFRMGLSLELNMRAGWRLNMKSEKKAELFGFMKGRPYLVLYDALMMGQFRKSVYTLSYEDIKQVVFEGAAGGGIRLPIGKTHISLTYGFYLHTPEADYGFNTRTHYWGRFLLSVGF